MDENTIKQEDNTTNLAVPNVSIEPKLKTFGIACFKSMIIKTFEMVCFKSMKIIS